MNKKAKASIILLIILLLISLAAAGGLFNLWQKEHVQNLALQEEIEDVKTRQKITEEKLRETEKTAFDLDSKLKEAKTQIEKLDRDLEAEKNAKLDALDQIEQLKTDLEQQKVLRADLEKRFTQAQKDIEKTQAQLRELQAQKMELEAKLNVAEGKSTDIELGTIMVTPEGAAPLKESVPAVTPESSPQPAPQKGKPTVSREGKILVVNKEHNFVVINLGSKDNINMDNLFAVYHENKYIGDVKVEKIHNSMAACGFVSAKIKEKISEGDKVVLKTKSKWSIF
jgi:hypothetical protein